MNFAAMESCTHAIQVPLVVVQRCTTGLRTRDALRETLYIQSFEIDLLYDSI